MKKLIALLLVALAALSLGACKKEPVVVHCNRCGKEIVYPAGENVSEDWIIVCPECLAKQQ